MTAVDSQADKMEQLEPDMSRFEEPPATANLHAQAPARRSASARGGSSAAKLSGGSMRTAAFALGALGIVVAAGLAARHWTKPKPALPAVAGMGIEAKAATPAPVLASTGKQDAGSDLGLDAAVPPAADPSISQVADQSVSGRPSDEIEASAATKATAAASDVAATATPGAAVAALTTGTDLAPTSAMAEGHGAGQAASVAQVGINAGFASAITQLQADVVDLRSRLAGPARWQANAGARPAAGAVSSDGAGSTAPRVARAPRARPPAPATPTTESAAARTPEASGRVLAVDLWDGKPSVVVGTGIADDKRVVFLAEGDRKGRVTLKEANVAAQEAVFDIQGQEARMRSDVAVAR